MNQLQKQAALYKLSSMQNAICYVLRQRFMRKQAEPLRLTESRYDYDSPTDKRTEAVFSPWRATNPTGTNTHVKAPSPHTLGGMTYDATHLPWPSNQSAREQAARRFYNVMDSVAPIGKAMYDNSTLGQLHGATNAFVRGIGGPSNYVEGVADHVGYNLSRPIHDRMRKKWQAQARAKQRALGRASVTSPDFLTPNPPGQDTGPRKLEGAKQYMPWGYEFSTRIKDPSELRFGQPWK